MQREAMHVSVDGSKAMRMIVGAFRWRLKAIEAVLWLAGKALSVCAGRFIKIDVSVNIGADTDSPLLRDAIAITGVVAE